MKSKTVKTCMLSMILACLNIHTKGREICFGVCCQHEKRNYAVVRMPFRRLQRFSFLEFMYHDDKGLILFTSYNFLFEHYKFMHGEYTLAYIPTVDGLVALGVKEVTPLLGMIQIVSRACMLMFGLVL